jgi:3-oxoacyl-[acyl-carrier protein] reductase
MKLKDRVCIVTGSAQGIGAAIAKEFAREGAIVAALDRNSDVEKVCETIQDRGGTGCIAFRSNRYPGE